MDKCIPNLWFKDDIVSVLCHYAKVFDEFEINDIHLLRGTPSGDIYFATFKILGRWFMALGGDASFPLNTSISFLLIVDSEQSFDKYWQGLGEEGKVHMEPDSYPFSPHFGWLEDKFGLNWQIMVDEEVMDRRPIPFLTFSGEQQGHARSALDYYKKAFKGKFLPDEEKPLMVDVFGCPIMIMDNPQGSLEEFNEAVSFLIECDSQKELDDYYRYLSDDPDAEQCGWVKDKYGISWQIIPEPFQIATENIVYEDMDKFVQRILKYRKINFSDVERITEGLKLHTVIPRRLERQEMIRVEALTKTGIVQSWEYYNNPAHIIHWNTASDDWQTTKAINDFKVGGRFSYTMAKKDGSVFFDFEGVYEAIEKPYFMAYRLNDGRFVSVIFMKEEGQTKIQVLFEAEDTYAALRQQMGWQRILDHFVAYTEDPHFT